MCVKILFNGFDIHVTLEHEITIYHRPTNTVNFFFCDSEMLEAQRFMPCRPRRVRVDIKTNCNYLDKK